MLVCFASLSGAFVATSSSAIFSVVCARWRSSKEGVACPAVNIGMVEHNDFSAVGHAKPLYTLLD